jgi:hypothetical protein
MVRPRRPDRAVVDPSDRRQLGSGPAEEDLVGQVEFVRAIVRSTTGQERLARAS